jgi:hypothetical protein
MTKISGLTALTSPATGDEVPIVDVDDLTMSSTGTTKRILVKDLMKASSIVTKTSNYTVTTSDYILLTTTVGGDVTYTLPDATTCQGQQFLFVLTDVNNNVTFATTGGQTIAGFAAADWILSQLGASLSLVSDGANWQPIGSMGSYLNITISALGELFCYGKAKFESSLTTTQIVTKTSNYTVTTGDYIILCDATSGGFALTLPDATTCLGQVFIIKKIDITGSQINISTVGGQTIDSYGGSPTYVLSFQSQAFSLVSDGTNWQTPYSEGFTARFHQFIQGFEVAGVAALNGGTDTSGTAAASSPAFVSGTALQLNTTQDTMLYIAIQTSAALAVAIGPTSGVANAILPSKSYALGMFTIRVPKGWYVKITGTIADLTITAVTC